MTISTVNYESPMHKENQQLHSHSFYLAQSHNIQELTLRIKKIITELGFSHFVFLRLERSWGKNSLYGFMHNYPEELIRHYCENKLYTSDLIIEYGKANTQPIFSSQIYNYIDNAPFEIELTRNNRYLTQIYRRFGFLEHCVIPMSALNGHGHVQLWLSKAHANAPDLQALAEPIMLTCRALCRAIDTVSTQKFGSSFIEKNDNLPKITHKPLQILQSMTTQDTTINDLATALHVSPITAHQHIAAARKALGVKTNIGAVIKAIKLGLVRMH